MPLSPENTSRALARGPWAILPDRVDALRSLIAGGRETLAARDDARLHAARGVTPVMRGAVAVVPVRGFLFHRPNWITEMGFGCAASDIGSVIEQLAANPDIRAIVLDVDSPGGETDGVPELVARIESAAAEKKIIAVANSMMASAAYWLSAPAAEIIITPSGMAGSIGVFWEHVEFSAMYKEAGITATVIKAGKFKAETNDVEPLTDEARSHMQELVDAHYNEFVKAVAKGRQATPAAVKAGFGEGRVLTAKLAVDAKLCDRIATLDDVIAKVGGGRNGATPGGRRAEALRRQLALDKQKVML